MQIHVNRMGENRLILSIIHILTLLYTVYIPALLLYIPIRHVAQLDNSGSFAAGAPLPAAAVRAARAV